MFLPQTPFASSQGLGWDAIEVETHDCASVLVPSQVSERHVLSFHNRAGGVIDIAEENIFRSYRVDEGSFCLSPAGHTAAFRWSTPRRLTFVGLEGSWWNRISEISFNRHVLPGRFVNASDGQVSHLLGALLAEVRAGNPSGPLLAELLSRSLLVRLCTAYAQNEGGAATAIGSAHAGGLTGWRLQSVLDRMRDDLSRTPSVDELAGLARLHPDHFARAFRQTTGLPPHRYLMKARIDKAAELLIKSDVPAATLAHQLGFSDQSHFQNVFRRHMGVTPGQYRQQSRHAVAMR